MASFREVAFPSRMCDMCIYVCPYVLVKPCWYSVRVCERSSFNPFCALSVSLVTHRSKIKKLGPRSFSSVCPRGGKKTNPQLERAVVVPHWKVVHLERLTAGVTGAGDTGAGKFWVISDLSTCGACLFSAVRGKKPAAIYQMDVQFLGCTCRDCNSDISLTPRHLNTLTLNPDSHYTHFCYDV